MYSNDSDEYPVTQEEREAVKRRLRKKRIKDFVLQC